MQSNSKVIAKMFFRLLPVQIFLVAISSLNNIIDGTIASNFIGPSAMAITSLFAPIMLLVTAINTVLVTGAQILCGQLLGRNQAERTRSVFSVDLLVTTGISVLVMLMCLLLPGMLANLCGATEGIRLDFINYLRGMAPGIPAYMIGVQLISFLQLEQQEKRTYIGIALMMISNIALDLLFVIKFQMGVFGLGMATTVSYWLFIICVGLYYFTDKAIIRFDKRALRVSDLGDIVLVGCPSAISQACQVLRGFLMNYLMIRCIGNDALSSFAVLNGTFGGLIFAATAGVAAATRLLVSVYSGEEDRTGLKLIIKTALYKGVPLVTAVTMIFVVLNVPLTRVFYRDPSSALYEMTRLGFIIFPLYAPMSCIYLIFLSFHQCFNRTKLTSILSVFDGFIGAALPAVILTPLFGMVGIWSSQVINGIITTLVILLYSVICNRKMPENFDELLVLPKNFGVPEEDRIDISIRSRDEVVHTAERVSQFCAGHGIDERRTMFASLAMEEMAGNIVDHGFTKDTKKHSIDVRVVYKENSLILRLRDDCILFNPKELSEIFDPEDVSRNVGIRLVSRIATEFTYQNTLGVNILTIRI